MRRRDFISAFSKYSLVATTASITAIAAAKSKDIAENSIDRVGKQLSSLRERMDKLESRQKNMTRALVVVTAVSTGIDFSLIL